MAALLALAVSMLPLETQAASELEQHLRAQYTDKILILRNFYQGDTLKYDFDGKIAGASPASGDWTVDGFVRVTSLSLSSRRLTIQAERLPLGNCGQGCGFSEYNQRIHQKAGKDNRLRITVDVEASGLTEEKATLALSGVFLSGRDRFDDLVPEYWKPCVLAASSGKGRKKYSACIFPQEFATIPGLASTAELPPDAGDTAPDKSSDDVVSHVSKGITPPKALFSPNPAFSEDARRAKYQGTAMLSLIVDKDGQVQNVRILLPLGLGLDQKAVESVKQWRFKPAEKDGQPVAMTLAVEVSFHLY